MFGTSGTGSPTATVLLVDCAEPERSALRQRLEAEGYAVREASTGPAANGVLFRLPEAGASLVEVERQLLLQALERCAWNQTRAGALLGINRDQVRYRIEKFGLTVPAPRTTLAIPSTR